MKKLPQVLLQLLGLALLFATSSATQTRAQEAASTDKPIPRAIHIQIMKAEDERRWDNTLSALLTDRNPAVRKRTALAAGRIGNAQAVPALVSLLHDDKDQDVRAMAAFAIGEVESNAGSDGLIAVLKNMGETLVVRARAIEALGKIAGELPKEKEERTSELGAIILESLRVEGERTPASDTNVLLLGLTAALRARPANAGPVIARFLTHADARVRADAANALARLRAKDANHELRSLLTTDADPVVRANAARVLGATEEKSASDVLLERALSDTDSRVRVSAIRALASIKDSTTADALLKRASVLIDELKKDQRGGIKYPPAQNELLEIVTTLGRLWPMQLGEDSLKRKTVERFFLDLRNLINPWAPEVEIAFVRVIPAEYFSNYPRSGVAVGYAPPIVLHWRTVAGMAQAIAEIASLPHSVQNVELKDKAESVLLDLFDNNSGSVSVSKTSYPYALPDILRGLAAFKPNYLSELLQRQLKADDIIVRSTAAELLGELPPSEQISQALIAAFPQTQKDALNDAALSLLDSLAKQKTTAANDMIKTAVKSNDYLVRQRAVSLLKANGLGDFSSNIGTVKSPNTQADYERALARIGRSVRAVVTTSKGSFTIELLPNDAPLTVDNFIRLAQRGYYRDITIHRVVSNFVIQDGDPRGDGNGGPGYQIRCEINEVPYERAAVGMALSGKDTGGSQWFVTHSRQPHLDGGYTVFGRVISGMNVVDSIVRGDVIQSITINQR